MDVVLSCYQQDFTSNHESLFNIEAIAQVILLFEQQMDFWASLFPEQIYRLSYEDLVQDQEKYTRELLSFTDLEWEDSCLHFYKNVGMIKTASKLQVRQPIYQKSVDRWRQFENNLAPAAKILGVY